MSIYFINNKKRFFTFWRTALTKMREAVPMMKSVPRHSRRNEKPSRLACVPGAAEPNLAHFVQKALGASPTCKKRDSASRAETPPAPILEAFWPVARSLLHRLQKAARTAAHPGHGPHRPSPSMRRAFTRIDDV
jgi:hypothetical protein